MPNKKDEPVFEKKLTRENWLTWLRRIADECTKKLPALKTMVEVKGVKKAVPVDHYKRLKNIYKDSGERGVVDYCKHIVDKYNSDVANHLKENK